MEKRLELVVLARFRYRHEAEFAAGFLEEADIPYRLQVDDANLGFTVSTPPTLWVRRKDLSDARDVVRSAELTPLPESEPRRLIPPEPRGRLADDSSSLPSWAADPTMAIDGRSGPRDATRLGGRERGFSLLLAGATGAAVPALPASMAVLGYGLILASVLFVVGALVGRLPAVLRGVVRALAGSAP